MEWKIPLVKHNVDTMDYKVTNLKKSSRIGWTLQYMIPAILTYGVVILLIDLTKRFIVNYIAK